MAVTRKLRMGMIGGGKGAFIGNVHRMASRLDGKIELVCGAFSSNKKKSQESGRELMIPDDRIYGDYKDMLESERRLPKGDRMDFVTIVTPNYLHFAPAKMALEYGFHVVSDKPVTLTLEEAIALQKVVAKSNKVFALTHNYTGYPMVKEAKSMISKGKLGKIRKVIVEYPQGWLSTRLEADGQKQAGWRTDPKKSGATGCMGDIGTHAENLAEYVTGLKIIRVCADLNAIVKGRKLDDDGVVLLEFDKGAKGLLFASQIAAGEENDLRIRVYGEKGGLDWRQMEPNSLIIKWLDKSMEVKRTGVGQLSKEAQHNTRLPSGHPEGFIEAFANIYSNFADTILSLEANKKPTALNLDFPTIEDGVRGMRFIAKIVQSNNSSRKWVNM